IALAKVINGVAQESTDERASPVGDCVPPVDRPFLGILLVYERNEDALEIAEIAHGKFKRGIGLLLRVGGTGESCAQCAEKNGHSPKPDSFINVPPGVPAPGKAQF